MQDPTPYGGRTYPPGIDHQNRAGFGRGNRMMYGQIVAHHGSHSERMSGHHFASCADRPDAAIHCV